LQSEINKLINILNDADMQVSKMIKNSRDRNTSIIKIEYLTDVGAYIIGALRTLETKKGK